MMIVDVREMEVLLSKICSSSVGIVSRKSEGDGRVWFVVIVEMV